MAEYDVQAGDWQPLGEATVYRWIPPTATYEALSPWVGDGRFDVDDVPTLYVSFSADGALAEYYRRHPELLSFQDGLKVQLFEVELLGSDDGLNVSSEARSDAVGFPWERLRSSDLRKPDRYRECRSLARDVVDQPGVSIQYPSAAYEHGENVVTFGALGKGWEARLGDPIDPLPFVDPDSVRALPAGAEQ